MRYLTTLCLIVLAASAATLSSFARAKPRRSRSRRPAAVNAHVLPDHAARALLRKSAPFLVEESKRGAPVRINKDGTFSRDVASVDYAPDGKWKIFNNRMKLRWNTGEEQEYPLAFSGKSPVIAGRRANTRGAFLIDSEN